jgi:hypothetical protein
MPNGSATRSRPAFGTYCCRPYRANSQNVSCQWLSIVRRSDAGPKAKTDMLSEWATTIVALMPARYPSTERFIRWYRQQAN